VTISWQRLLRVSSLKFKEYCQALYLISGAAVSWDGYFNEQIKNDAFSPVIDLLLNCASFIYIGAWLPFDQFNTPELGVSPWRLVILLFLILLFRRIPSLLLLYKWVPEIDDWRQALFSGHFGAHRDK